MDRWANGEIKRLMIFVPPQHGKSELTSRLLPAKLLGDNPRSKIILASYSATLANSFNRDCKRYIDSDAYKDLYPETQLSLGNKKNSWIKTANMFETVGFGGFLKSVGVGGSLTGSPADYAIIDDPVKDAIEAMSPVYQERIWNWFTDVLYTRIHNNSSILITQTRWDVNDLSGKIIKNMELPDSEQWEILVLPAIKTEQSHIEDPREVGEALWEEKHSLAKLQQVRRQSIRTFEALYQQNPKPVQVGGEAYEAFSQSIVQKVNYNPKLPIHVTFDFNKRPYCTALIAQVYGKEVRYIKEFCLPYPKRLPHLINAIAIHFKDHQEGMFIYGDPDGNKEDYRTEEGLDNYAIIINKLSPFRPKYKVLKAPPGVASRIAFSNAIFSENFEGIKVLIDPSCTNLINDFTFVKENSDGTKLKKKVRDVASNAMYEEYGHTSDAHDYFICSAFAREYQIFCKPVKGINVRMGKNTSKNNF